MQYLSGAVRLWQVLMWSQSSDGDWTLPYDAQGHYLYIYPSNVTWHDEAAHNEFLHHLE